MHKLTKAVLLAAALATMALIGAGCGGHNGASANEQRQQAIKLRANTYARAAAQIPNPIVTNFPRRQTLVDAVKRQSLPNHPWYVYILGQNGNIVNYFVAKSVPVNDCDYLAAAQQINDQYEGPVVVDSPSMEGIYQSSSGCNTLTFFDLSTGAEIQVSSTQSFVTDRPLRVEAEAIKVTK